MMGEGVSCEDQVIEVTDASTGKRKRYASVRGSPIVPPYRANSYKDDPMQCWRPHDQMFLHELLRHEGLAGDHHNLKCASCKIPPSSDTMFYKCADCGVHILCGSCCLEQHQHLPLHRIAVRSVDIFSSDKLIPPNSAGPANFGTSWSH